MTSIWKALREAGRNKSFLVGLAIMASLIAAALLADWISPYTYDEMVIVEALRPPSGQHWLGTDHLGRDSFSRLIHGSRIALKVGAIAVTIQTVVGVLLGLLAGYYGGWQDRVIIFLTDVIWALPPIVLAIAICTLLGPSLTNVIIAIAAVSWAQFTRIVRSKTQALKNMPYVEAARAMGESDLSIILRYILPNVIPVIIVLATLALPVAVVNTTALGFLGLGAQPPLPDWGVILSESMTYIRRAPWISIFPGLAIIYVVLGFNLLGEGLRDALDPRLKV
ncbi:MAG: ABC transporter permease [Desulfobacterales bacterium]|nr:ABC transporter permease [Desulfobacterales bacterium]